MQAAPYSASVYSFFRHLAEGSLNAHLEFCQLFAGRDCLSMQGVECLVGHIEIPLLGLCQ